MSFFRVLLALLISGGIAYGLYRAVDGQGVERVVEAVRTEIEEPKGTSSEAETATLAEPDTQAGNSSGTDTDDSAETSGETGESETAAAPVVETEQPAEPSESDVAASEAETPDETNNGQSENGGEGATPSDDKQVAALASESENKSVSENNWAAKVESSVKAEADLDKPMVEKTDPDDGGESEGAGAEIAALPAVQIAGATSDSVDALKIVTGGMKYREALATLTNAGWQQRVVTDREGEPNAAETALLEAGYAELEGCQGNDRPICRFEFIDGQKRIAAVITAGTGTDPNVIDAFLMDIAVE